MAERTLTVRILGDAKSAQAAFATIETAASSASGRLEAVSEKFRGAGQRLGEVGKRMTIGVTAPLALLGKASFDAASDLNESMSKVGVVFGDAAGDIDAFARSAAKNLGQSRQEALEAAGTFGNLFTSMGLGQKPAADLSKGIVTLGSDLASFNNIAPEEALEKLRSGLVGEIEPLRQLGINFDAAAVEAKAMAMGLVDANGEVSESAKLQARYALIMEQSGSAQRDFARTADGVANKQRIANAQFKDAAATLGNALLPIGQQVIGFFSRLAERFGELSPRMQKFALIGAGIAAAIGPLATIFSGLAFFISALLSPIGLVVAAVAGLVAGFIYAYRNIEGLRDVVGAVAGFLTGTVVPAVQQFAAAVVGHFSAAVEWVKRIWPQISEAIGHVLDVARGIIRSYIDVVSAIWRAWGDDIFRTVRTAFDYVRGTIDNVLQVVRGVIQTVLAVINGDWGRAWDGIKQIFAGVWDQITNIMRTTVDVLRAVVGGIVSSFGEVLRPLGNFLHTWIVEPFERVVGFVRDLPGRIASAASGMFDGIKDAFRGALNFIIDRWNALRFVLGGQTVNFPGPLGSISIPQVTLDTPNIPRLAHGGIVRARPGGTLALLGEAGRDEVVIPLPRTPAPLPAPVSSTYNVYVTAGMGTDGATVGAQVVDAIKEYERRNGKGWRS
ncbi:MAG: hypothetical protein M3Q48_09815 [Actinomycetota bacterium]|nr:hypothetical protein [Actinomycetota bacterium]